MRRPLQPVQGSTARLNGRLGALVVVVAVFVALLALRLVQLQVLDHDRYATVAKAQHTRQSVLPAGRGSILDREGRALAVSSAAPTLMADREEVARSIDDTFDAAAQLTAALADDPTPRNRVDMATLQRRLSPPEAAGGERPGRFVVLARKVSAATAAKVEALGLDEKAVYFDEEPQRRYPSGSLAAAVLGHTDIDHNGKAGVEQTLDGELTGRAGQLVRERDSKGRSIPTDAYKLRPARAGDDVQLTIDTAIQSEAEAALADGISRYDAKGGVAIVMDPRTGDVLAYASNPTYDPNRPWAASPEQRRIWGVSDVFEPGSTSKMVTMAAALETGVVTPDTPMVVPDRIRVWDREFKDSDPHGPTRLSARQVMAVSSNVGTIDMATKVGSTRLSEYLDRFGYGRKTGVELPAESRGIVKDPMRWNGPDIASISIGHTVAVTPLQMVRAFGVIANDGRMVEPRLVSSRGVGDDRVAVPRPDPIQVVRPETAVTMRDVLTSVVTEGTAALAAVPGHAVAGKTGTSRKPRADGSGYDEDRHVASFVGMLPAEAPRVVIAVVLDEPDLSYGGLTAAPVFSRLAAFTMRELRVPPNPQAVAPGKPISLAGGTSRAAGPIKPRTPSQERRAAAAAPAPAPAPEPPAATPPPAPAPEQAPQ